MNLRKKLLSVCAGIIFSSGTLMSQELLQDFNYGSWNGNYLDTDSCSCCDDGCNSCGEDYCNGTTQYCYPVWGVWLPESPLLFLPFVADPRQVCYSVGWRFNDQVLKKNIIDVSYGDTLGIIEWCNVWPWCGRMRIDIEGALWAVFSPLEESAPLINADYYVGVPITYGICNWSFRLRVFHISSHIGDEFLLNHRHFKRKNPSAEYLDFSVSNNITEDIRIYGVLGLILHQDESFRNHRFYAEAGMELRLYEVGSCCFGSQIYGVPFFGMHFRYRRDFKHHVDSTYVLGYEWQKRRGLFRCVRAFMEYHDGYSVEGQFAKCPTNYFSLRMSYGF